MALESGGRHQGNPERWSSHRVKLVCMQLTVDRMYSTVKCHDGHRGHFSEGPRRDHSAPFFRPGPGASSPRLVTSRAPRPAHHPAGGRQARSCRLACGASRWQPPLLPRQYRASDLHGVARHRSQNDRSSRATYRRPRRNTRHRDGLCLRFGRLRNHRCGERCGRAGGRLGRPARLGSQAAPAYLDARTRSEPARSHAPHARGESPFRRRLHCQCSCRPQGLDQRRRP